MGRLKTCLYRYFPIAENLIFPTKWAGDDFYAILSDWDFGGVFTVKSSRECLEGTRKCLCRSSSDSSNAASH